MAYYQSYYDDSSSSNDISNITYRLSKFSIGNNGRYQNHNFGINNSFIDINDRHRCNKIPVETISKRYRMMWTDLPKEPVTLTTIKKRSYKFQSIEENLPYPLYLTKLLQVDNPYLKMAFNLKRTFAYNNVKPKQMYHGTKFKHFFDICKYNFDWRLAGLEKGHRYGQGVNFTSNPKFALNFCDTKKNMDKILIMADVLIIKCGVGKENLKVPPKGCDTTMRENGSTFVKFYDAEFCPTYVLHVTKQY